jgi:hypothetical protein
VGNTAAVPLGLSLAELNLGALIKSGAEGSVFRGSWRGQEVAVKRFKIQTSDDLVRYRRELQVLAIAQHPNIARLLGERALATPPARSPHAPAALQAALALPSSRALQAPSPAQPPPPLPSCRRQGHAP